MRRAAVVALLALAACSGDDRPAPLGDSQMKPKFAPDTTTTSVGAVPGTSAGATATAPTASAMTTAPAARSDSDVTDRVGDVVSGVERPPAWADLAGGHVTVIGTRIELRIRLAGTVPHKGDQDHTMNAAAFFDVNGNGRIDYEVWANLAPGAWGPAYYDDLHGGGLERSDEITVEPVGRELVLHFPLSLLGDVSTFRWGLASEWSRYETLGTIASARDEAPDGDGAVRHPA